MSTSSSTPTLIQRAKSFARGMLGRKRPEQTGRSTEYRDALLSIMQTAPWCVDEAGVEDGYLEIKGWALPGRTGGQIRVNGTPFEVCETGLQRPDIGRIFWYVEDAERSGFRCRSPLASLKDTSFLVFEYADPESGAPLDPNQRCYFDLSDGDLPLPAPERRKRVHGHTQLSGFQLEGLATFVKLGKALERIFGRSFKDFSSILDWGCGCGRVSRHFLKGPSVHLTGIDIDGDNVTWCSENLRHGALADAKFTAVPLHPPTSLPDQGFDLLFGISVFTHLKEKEQFEWLAELSRIAKPGAVLLMTVLSNASVCRSCLPVELFSALETHGFMDAGANPDLDGAITDSDYYKNVFHTHDYIRSRWSEHFEIREIIPGHIGNHQDLVVMVKR